MSTSHEVSIPIINSPFKAPTRYYEFREGVMPKLIEGRREARYWERQQKQEEGQLFDAGHWINLDLVNRIRERLYEWRESGYPGVTSITLELLKYWNAEDRADKGTRLFYAQIEAAETVIFLKEARADLLQGIDVPPELDSPIEEDYRGFVRYALKMATGSGKTTVMGMLCAWSILNKVHYPRDTRFSDQILVVSPNVTIRDRLQELKPELDTASVYAKRDLVPPSLRTRLNEGHVAVTNWHNFEPRVINEGGVSAAVVKRGKLVVTEEIVYIGRKDESKRGKRILTKETFDMQFAAGLLGEILERKIDKKTGELVSARIRREKYVESDRKNALRVLNELGFKRRSNILVLNDEAHHAYRIQQVVQPAAGSEEESEELEYEQREATVWINGLDRINRFASDKSEKGLNFVVDFSATPFYITSVGAMANKPFRWIVSDFSLVDAIESGLVKVPQLAVRDYYNLWDWVRNKLETGERGGSKGEPKPEAILRHAHIPVGTVSGEWRDEYKRWEQMYPGPDGARPVLIIVCKNKKLAKLLYEWIAEEKTPEGLPDYENQLLKNRAGEQNTLLVYSDVTQEDPEKEAKNHEQRWLRFMLDTVGKQRWPVDNLGNPVYPADFVDTAARLKRPLDPPGRHVRCIISVGMLTEGWDCQTVTHIIGLRPFTSQLLCEQVVGRGLRRVSYEADENDMFAEEVAQVVGVPFEVVPFKASGKQVTQGSPKVRVFALPEKSRFEIRYPRVSGYYREIRNRIKVDWANVPELTLTQDVAPTQFETVMMYPGNSGRMAMHGASRMDTLTLEKERANLREGHVTFSLAAMLCREIVEKKSTAHTEQKLNIPRHVLLQQVVAVVEQYMRSKVKCYSPNKLIDVYFAPYFGWMIENLREHMRPDVEAGEDREMPRYESSRGPGTTFDVDFPTSKKIEPANKTHLNYVVFDTDKWEQSAAYQIDIHPNTEAFVKNDHLYFAIPYFHNAKPREYIPDFIVRLATLDEAYLIFEPKGFDGMAEHKLAAAVRWCEAVSAEGSYGRWHYAQVRNVHEIREVLDHAANTLARGGPALVWPVR